MTCAGCTKTMIAVSVSIGGDSKSSTGRRAWHPRCFACTNCRQSLLNEKYFVRNDKWPYCLHCRDFMFAARCATCVKPIRRYAAMAFNLFWHRGCFRCQSCSKLIEHEYYLAYGNLWVCPGCYRRPDNVYDYGMPDFLKMDVLTIDQIAEIGHRAPTIGDTTSLNPDDLTADDFQIFMDDTADNQRDDFPEKIVEISDKKMGRLKQEVEKEDDIGHLTITDFNAQILGVDRPDVPSLAKSANNEFLPKTMPHDTVKIDDWTKESSKFVITKDPVKSAKNIAAKDPMG
uniref:LIM zinc-binding domain-containing protein n=1 Tax=Romanomermis culicivorax TaxID=13658 RepID=A0A915HRF6_ROMCU